MSQKKPSYAEVAAYVAQQADRYGVPKDLLLAQMHQESRGNVTARSSANAYGPMQLMPDTAKGLRVDRDDWKQNVEGGAKLMSQLLPKYNNNVALALAAYNAGPGNVQKHGGVPPFKETQNYVRNITAEVNNGLPNVKQYVQNAGGTVQNMGVDMVSGKESSIPSFDELNSLGKTQPKTSKAPRQTTVESTTPSFDELNKLAATQPTNKVNAAPSGFTNQVARGTGLAARALAPYGAAAATGAALGSVVPGVGTAAGAVMGPVALAGTDLASAAYNAIGPRLGGPRMMSGTEAIDRLADKLGMPRPETKGERIIQDVGRGVAGTGGQINAATQALQTATSPVARGLLTQIASQPGTQYAAATGGTLLPSVAREVLGVENPAAQLGLGIAGSLAGGGVAAMGSNIRGNNFANPEVGKTVEAARRAGVNLTAAEAAPQSMAGRFMTGLRKAGNVTDDRAAELSGQVGSMVETRTNLARPANVTTEINAADRAIRNDLVKQYTTAKTVAGKLYDAVDDALAAKPGTDKVQLSNTQAKAVELLSEYPDWGSLTNAGKSTQSRIEAIVKGTSAKPSTIVGADGSKMLLPPDTSFKDMRSLSKDVGQLLEATRNDPKLANVHGQLKGLYSAIQSDADNWAQNTTNTLARDAYTDAQTFFKQNVAPFRENTIIYSAVNKKAREGIYAPGAEKLTQRIISSGPETTNLTTNLLSDEGKAAFRFSLIEDARERGMNPDAASIFSYPGYQRQMNLGRADTPTPQRIAMGTEPGALAQAEETQAILDMARTAGSQMKAAPRTGAMLVPMAARGMSAGAGEVLGNMLGAPMGVGGLGGALLGPSIAAGTERLMSTAPVTNMLLAPSYVPGAGLLQSLPNVANEENNPYYIEVTGKRGQ